MTQPSFAPITEADQVRPGPRLQAPGIWTQSRPSELRSTRPPAAHSFGRPGPDQGFALKLAHRFTGELRVAEGETIEDAVAGCTAVAMRRSASFGRAPVVHDLRFAFTLWGFFDGAPEDLVRERAPLFRSAGHHYQNQRAIADAVHDDALQLSPEVVAQRLADWRQLVSVPAPGSRELTD